MNAILLCAALSSCGAGPADATLALARQYAQSGNWKKAQETYAIVAERYAKHPSGQDGLRWLVQYHSSSEARRCYEIQNAKELAANPPVGAQNGLWWYQAATALEPKFAAHGTAATDNPGLMFPLFAAKRQLGESEAGRDWMRKFKGDAAWKTAAQQELWLLDRNGPAPRFAVNCRKTDTRPHLDAKFDDACWTNMAPMTLGSAEPIEGYTSRLRLAYDDEYFYVAIECTHPEASFRPAFERRSHDMAVDASDRIELILDMDRDYATYYRLRVDQRGALAEDCWGDVSWNPQWYVAFANTPSGYSAEIAIKLTDLTSEPIGLGKAWAMNAVRIIPGKGVQAASTPADATPRPEGCGLMMFVDPNRR